jgi:hypothetical protein
LRTDKLLYLIASVFTPPLGQKLVRQDIFQTERVLSFRKARHDDVEEVMSGICRRDCNPDCDRKSAKRSRRLLRTWALRERFCRVRRSSVLHIFVPAHPYIKTRGLGLDELEE